MFLWRFKNCHKGRVDPYFWSFLSPRISFSQFLIRYWCQHLSVRMISSDVKLAELKQVRFRWLLSWSSCFEPALEKFVINTLSWTKNPWKHSMCKINCLLEDKQELWELPTAVVSTEHNSSRWYIYCRSLRKCFSHVVKFFLFLRGV